jgi:hypothetical protein
MFFIGLGSLEKDHLWLGLAIYLWLVYYFTQFTITD